MLDRAVCGHRQSEGAAVCADRWLGSDGGQLHFHDAPQGDFKLPAEGKSFEGVSGARSRRGASMEHHPRQLVRLRRVDPGERERAVGHVGDRDARGQRGANGAAAAPVVGVRDEQPVDLRARHQVEEQHADGVGGHRGERRRRADNDLGYTLYLGMPYYARWIWAAAKMLVDKKHVSLAELQEKIAEVKSRYEKK